MNKLLVFIFITVVALRMVGSATRIGILDSYATNGSFFSPLNSNNISGIDYGIISSMNQTNESRDLDESNVSSSSENQTSAP